ncbi:hypothetical protein V6Z11_D02G020200 [Gossypium hirsutum]
MILKYSFLILVLRIIFKIVSSRNKQQKKKSKNSLSRNRMSIPIIQTSSLFIFFTLDS